MATTFGQDNISEEVGRRRGGILRSDQFNDKIIRVKFYQYEK